MANDQILLPNDQILLLYRAPTLFTKRPLLKQISDLAALGLDDDFKKNINALKNDFIRYQDEETFDLKDDDYINFLNKVRKLIDTLKEKEFETLTTRKLHALFNAKVRTLNSQKERTFYDANQRPKKFRLHESNGNLKTQNLLKNLEARVKAFHDRLNGLESKYKQHKREVQAIEKKAQAKERKAYEQQQNRKHNQSALKRLDVAIGLMNRYVEQFKNEDKSWWSFLNIFHWFRRGAKAQYCTEFLTSLCDTHDQYEQKPEKAQLNVREAIEKAHHQGMSHCKNSSAVMAGGSWFGTSRLLSVQRALGIKEAWKFGKSRFGLFSTNSDYHGLKQQHMVATEANHPKKIATQFFNRTDDSAIEASYNTMVQSLKL